jgi:putative ABC transport system permease protein
VALSAASADTVYLRRATIDAVAQVPGVARLEAQRLTPVVLDPTRPAVTVIARPIVDPGQRVPLVGALVAAPRAATPIYVSEAVEARTARIHTTLAMLPQRQARRRVVAGVCVTTCASTAQSRRRRLHSLDRDDR